MSPYTKPLKIHAGMSASTIREKTIQHIMSKHNVSPEEAANYFNFWLFIVERSVKSVQNQRYDR